MALLASWPQTGGEVKKGFRITWRARRLLITACLLAALNAALLLMPAGNFGVDALRPALLTAAGLMLLLLAPLYLICANLLLRPVETFSASAASSRARAIRWRKRARL